METNLMKRFSGRKILITGATGFLGSHLINRFRDCGAEIHGTSRFKRLNSSLGVHWNQLDLLDLGSIRGLIARLRPDVIFHFAGQATAAPDLQLVLPSLESLLISTVNLLIAASDARCGRLVLLGSLTEPLGGHNEPVPGSPYAAAKYASSLYGRMFQALYGVPVVIARPFMTYGPGQDSKKLIPYVVTSLLDEKPPRLSNGELQADWIYIDDVIEGLLAIADVPGLEGETIDLGSGELTSVRSIVNHLVALTGTHVEPLFGALPDRPKEQVRVADTEHTFSRLGWKPTISLSQGLQETVAWLRQQRIASSKLVYSP